MILGAAGTQPLAIDLERLVESRLLVQGTSGSGKSYAVRRLLEQTHGRVQHLVVDVEGEYVSLRERYDYVLAGADGDCAAEPRSASLLARRLLELGASAILNVSELRPHDRTRFVRALLESLLAAPRSLWHPVLVVLEESHLFAPQSGREAESAAAVIDLATRGRKRGFALCAVTQRISDLAKSVVAQCGNRLIGRTTLDADVKRAAYELGFAGREEARRLAELPRGEFFVFGPALSDLVVRVQVGETETVHGVRRGQRARPAPPRETVQRVLAQMADLPHEAEREARTIDEAQRQIVDLQRELAAAKRSTRESDPKALSRARDAGRAEGAREAEARLSRFAAHVQARDGRTAHALDAALVAVQKAADAVREPLEIDLSTRPARARPAAPPMQPVRGVSSVDLHLGAERRLLAVLASRHPARFTRAQLGTLAGLAYTGGTFSTYLSRLRSHGLLEEDGDLLGCNPAGLDAAGEVPPTPSSPEEVQAMWRRAVGPSAAGRVLDALLAQYPAWVPRAELAAACDLAHTGGTFSAYLSRLRTNGLLEERGSELRASAMLLGKA
jgi:hypothetical protein